MRLALLFCDTRGLRRGNGADELPDQDEAAVAPAVAALRELGHGVEPVPVRFDSLPGLPARLSRCDAVFNLCDGSGADGTAGPGVPALLQQVGIPFTGCSADSYLLSVDKARARRAMQAAGVPIPEGRVLAGLSPAVELPARWPVIVKPREGFGSIGVDHDSVVARPEDFAAAVRRAGRAGDGDVLVERFLPGRELSVALIGPPDAPAQLPPVEFCFGPSFASRPAVRTLRSKQDPSSPEYREVEVVRAMLDPATALQVRAAASAAWGALGCDGYGRVDLRLDESGRPYVIEVNTNCSLESGPEPCDCGTMVLAARLAGWGERELLATILAAGLARAPLAVRAPASARWTPEVGHSLHTLRPIAEGEVLAEIQASGEAGRGARRPWRLGGKWVVPDPPARWARAAGPARAQAAVVESPEGLRLVATRDLERFEEVRVAGRERRRGPEAFVYPGAAQARGRVRPRPQRISANA